MMGSLKATPYKPNLYNREIFTYGNCAILAKELHKITGWELALSHWGTSKRRFFGRVPEDTLRTASHAVVISPCKKFVIDVDGLQTVDVFKQKWNSMVTSVNYKNFEEATGHWNFYTNHGTDLLKRSLTLKHQIQLANKMAKRIVNKIGI